MKDSKTIAVIEDNLPIRKLFATLLKKSGYEVVDFSNGELSADWLKDNTVLAIVMDILLPDINGTELIKQVRAMEQHKDIPIVAVTGFAQANDENRFIELGFDMYVSKPVSTASFVSDLEKVISDKYS